jgi:hypothetical protein
VTVRALALACFFGSGCSLLAPLDGIFCEDPDGCGLDAGARSDGAPLDAGAPTGLYVVHASKDPARGEKRVRVELQLLNAAEQNVPLSELTVRYYFTLENALRPVFECEFVPSGAPPFRCANIRAVVRNLDPPRATARQVIELTFTADAGELVAGGGMTGLLQVVARTADYDVQDQSNDYSYEMTSTPQVNDRITIHRGVGPPLWGREP